MVYDISYFANHIYKLYVRLSDGGHAEIQGSDEPPKASARKRSMPHAACRMPHAASTRMPHISPRFGLLAHGPDGLLDHGAQPGAEQEVATGDRPPDLPRDACGSGHQEGRQVRPCGAHWSASGVLGSTRHSSRPATARPQKAC